MRLIHSIGHQVGKMSYKEIKQKALKKLQTHGFNQELGELVVDQLDLESTEDDQLEALKKKELKLGVVIEEMMTLRDDRKLKDTYFNMVFPVERLIVFKW